MKFKLTKTLIEEISLLIEEKKLSSLIYKFENMHPADTAEIIKNINIKTAKTIIQKLNKELSAEILIELEDDIREKILSEFTPKKIAKEVIDNLDSDDATDVIQDLPEEKKIKVLSHIKNQDLAEDIESLLLYEENQAGGLMAKELVKVNINWKLKTCLREMRKQAENLNSIYNVYVVDEQGKLKGTLSLKKLLITASESEISHIYNPNVISVKANDLAENVAIIFKKYDLVALPVLNDENILIGRITVDDVIDFMEEEAEKDYQLASGISEDIEYSDNIINQTKARLPWLIIGAFGGLIGALILEIFTNEDSFIKLALFIPLIAAMAGNAGIQSSALIVQGIANNSLKMNNILNKIIKESAVASFNGIICSIIIFTICVLIGQEIYIGITVGLSLLIVIVCASLFGTIIPLVLEKLKIDPALATGPFITTLNDILSIIIYFSVAKYVIMIMNLNI